MKKLLVLMTALALVALALPAFAQPDSNINGNGVAAGNTNGSASVNNQFAFSNTGDQSQGFINKSTVTATGNLSNNWDLSDNSGGFINKSTIGVDNVGNDYFSNNTLTVDDNSGGAINKSTITVFGSLNGNQVGNTTNTVTLAGDLSNSLNGNTLYIGEMTNAFTSQYQFTHQFDHQMAFGEAFHSATNGTFYIPISNTHMEQANTGISAGNYAGAASGANLMNMGNAQVSGMFALTGNVGGVGTNQAVLNAVTAFSAPAP